MSDPTPDFSATPDTLGGGRRRGIRHRVGLALLSLFTGLGVLGTVAVAIDWLQRLETWSWAQARCTIETSEVVRRPEVGDHLFAVEYSFLHGGGRQTGSDYRHGYAGSDREAEARVLASRYRPGETVPCWVDPEDPGDSALLRADLWQGIWIFVPLLFVAVGGGAIWLLLRGGLEGPEPREAGEGATRGLRSLGRGSLGKGLGKAVIPAVLFGVFFLVGTGMLVPFFVWPMLRVLEARSWVKVPCEILESGVAAHVGDDSTTYSVQVLFRYTWEGRERLSDRYRFLGGSSSGYEGKAEAVGAIPPGTRTTCFVDPESPEQAVLDRGLSGDFLFGLIPLLFALIGAGGLGFTLFAARAARRAAARPSWRPPPVEERKLPATGPVTLEPRSGPFGKLLGVLAVALFWNGFVGIFVWVFVKQWRAGHVDWFALLILTPFVLIGLLLLTGIPYSLLALLNPRPWLRLSRGALRPGESAQIEWGFRGLPGRIGRLTLRLVGAPPSARSGDPGDDPFAVSIDIADRHRGHGVAHGTASFTVPAGVRPTSRHGADAYSWKLVLKGEIDNWPDVAEEYEIEVLDTSA